MGGYQCRTLCGSGTPGGFNFYNAVNTATSYYNVGKFVGAGTACVGGAIVTLNPVTCLVTGPVGTVTGGVAFGIYGFFVGGFDLQGSELMDGASNVDTSWKH